MRKMKPFSGMKTTRRADGGEVREGPHRGISDETRRRAMEAVERRQVLKSLADEGPPSGARKAASRPAAKAPAARNTGASGESMRAARAPVPPPEEKPAPKAAPKPAEKPAEKPASKPVTYREDRSIPAPISARRTEEASKASAQRMREQELERGRRAGREAMMGREMRDGEPASFPPASEEGRRRVGTALGAAAAAIPAGRALMSAGRGAAAALSRIGARKQTDAARRMNQEPPTVSEMARRAREQADDMASRAAARKEAARAAERRQDKLDEMRMGGEGGGFRKGGAVRGAGIARKGVKKGKMR